MRSAVRLQACMTVVWLRLPNARPIAGRVASVSSRERYMATWRAQATCAARLEESMLLERDAEGVRRSRCWISWMLRRAGRRSG